VESGGNEEEPNIKSSKQQDLSSKDDLALGLSTLDKILEPNLPEPPPLSLNTSAKKPHYVLVPTNKAKLKKKINGDIGEQNVVKGKRLKGQLKIYVGFLTDVTNQSLLA